MEIPTDLVDAYINGGGDVYLLRSGSPHLIVHRAGGSEEEYDLGDVSIPGGMYVEGNWGFYVTCSVTHRIYRFDRTGEASMEWECAERPGDVCLSGLSVVYVSMVDGTVRTLEDTDDLLARLPDSGDGRLTSSGGNIVYTGNQVSILMEEYSVPEILPRVGPWTAAGNSLAVMRDSCICSYTGEVLFHLPENVGFNRFSLSPEGTYCILWTAGGDSMLVLQ
ncbi:MAG: hypothetical protein GF388_10635 [Candidatus Aegiribacteria sp.]|nr:hypothetical protein [Candidatus Aegiribacteria sp.]